jgi:hypothetical protein
MNTCKHTGLAALFGAAALVCAAGGASALTITQTGNQLVDQWDTEPGQSIPTRTSGYVDGQIAGDTHGSFVFTYGPDFLVAGATGHGNSTLQDSFWVGTHQVFCNPAAAAAGGCGGVASTVGQTFTLVGAGPGTLPFHFQFGSTGQNTIDNGENASALGATLVTAITLLPGNVLGTTPNLTGSMALVGLSDAAYPGDHDFQDLTVMIREVPEPATMAMLGMSLVALGVMRRRNLSR